MKHLLTILFCTLYCLLTAQNDTIVEYWHVKDKKQPTAKEVLLRINVNNLDQRKMPEVPVQVVQTGSGNVWQGITGRFGEVLFLVPKDREYRIDAGDETGIETIRVSNEPYAREVIDITYLASQFTEEERNDTIYQKVSRAQTPTRSRVLVVLTILDLDDRPINGEDMYFAVKRSGKVYHATTDRTGKAYLMLPMGESYCISTRIETNLKCYDMPQDDRAGQLNIRYNTIGTQAVLKRRAERARLAFVRDSLYRIERERDSIAWATHARRQLNKEDNFVQQLLFGEQGPEVQQRIARRAAEERDSVNRDPHYFEKTGSAVQAALYRMRERWKHKVIVTDLTGSMTPYMDQVIMWHALQLVQGEENRYFFFNDGDARDDSDKPIGKTGGIYFTDHAEMDQLLQTMMQTAKAGYGGDGPENDLEALLEGAQKLHGLDELVLVADNYSDVRDIELLTRLKVPVHIILCGTESGVNENYLEIAFKTGGSVHTIEQDIEDLAQLVDGATLNIGPFRYRVNRGKFIKVTKL